MKRRVFFVPSSIAITPPIRLKNRTSKTERVRRGYTLLELMVALTLSLFLLGTINLALNLQVQYSVAGRSASVRSQVLRSVIAQLTQDIHSIVPQAQLTPPDQSARTDSLENQSVLALPARNKRSEHGPTCSLVGSSEFLVLQTHHMPRSFTSSVPATIVWHRGNVDVGNFQKLTGFDFDTTTLSKTPGTDTSGLLRTDLVPAVTQRQPIVHDRQPTIRVDEIQHVRFRFYDGRQWLGSWNSFDQSSLPLAVEVSMDLQQSSEPNSNVVNRRQAFRVVIDLPTSHLQSTIRSS